MSKKKKICISLIIIFSIILASISTLLIVRHYHHKITFTINDTLLDGNGKKATVILLGGQSNASGCSRDEYLKKNVSTEKYAEYESGYSNVYINYLSGANESKGFVKCSVKQGEIEDGFGPELGMAEKLHELYPNQIFFIIKCAWGGTNLFEQWLSPSSKGKTGNLYKKFEVYVNTSLKYLESKNYDISIAGMCWMQGESDSFSIENATDYKDNLSNFIKDIRKEFSRYKANDGIAFIDAEIADNPAYWVYCDIVNNSKKAVCEQSSLNTLINTNAEGLTYNQEPKPTPDMAHYDSISEIKLGHLFIERLSQFLGSISNGE